MTINQEQGYEDLFQEEGELRLATFALCTLRCKGYKQLKFLCKIWGIESVFEKFYVPYKDDKGNSCLGNKDEIVVRLRAIMRQEENKRRTYRRRFPITTPESIRR